MRIILTTGDVFDGYEPPRDTMEVIVTDDRPVDTGLLDAHGNKLYREPTRRPIGFRMASE
ncbi:MAG: hypothetical protein WBV77_13255 [Solirubrobacteraceae bacterium]